MDTSFKLQARSLGATQENPQEMEPSWPQRPEGVILHPLPRGVCSVEYRGPQALALEPSPFPFSLLFSFFRLCFRAERKHLLAAQHRGKHLLPFSELQSFIS